jgi:hypothetical protein
MIVDIKSLIELLESGKRQCYKYMDKCIRDTHKPHSGKMWKLWIPKENPLPLLLVAHIDTVGTKLPYVLNDGGIIRSYNKQVLGGDDRAGVYIVGQIVKRMERKPYVLLCDEEERGMIGAYAFADSGMLEGLDVNIYVEYDRRGINEYVTYLQPKTTAIQAVMEAYGYVKAFGTYSDVKALSQKTNIAHVNLSAGYFNQHSIHETLSLAGVQFAIETGPNMLPVLCEEKHECDDGGGMGFYGGRGKSKWDGHNSWWSSYKNGKSSKKNDYKSTSNGNKVVWRDNEADGYWEMVNGGEWSWVPDKGKEAKGYKDRCEKCGMRLWPEDKGDCPGCFTIALASIK